MILALKGVWAVPVIASILILSISAIVDREYNILKLMPKIGGF